MRVGFGAVGVVLLAVLRAPAAAAQAPSERPPGPYVIDLRVATSALPQDASFFPPVPTATAIPAYGLGIDIGAHVYLFNLGPARVGLGADMFRTAGQTSPVPPTGNTTSPPQRILPKMETRVRMFTPQLSFNFGSAAGWSYISVGVGQISTRTATSEFAGSPATVTPASTRESAALQTINVGGGARWFTDAHLAFSFDVRFHKAAARTKNEVSTAAVTLVTASAGISLK